jgi:MFS family permease
MLPYTGRKLAGEAGNLANPLIAAALVLPQLVVAILSPGVGRAAEARGRRAVLMFGFASEPVRGLLFALVNQPVALVLVQALDGVGAAVVGVMLPLIAADIARQRGHFNLTMGAIGMAVGGGAAASTAVAGLIDDYAGITAALLALAGAGLIATLAVWLVMPESADRADIGRPPLNSSSSPEYRRNGRLPPLPRRPLPHDAGQYRSSPRQWTDSVNSTVPEKPEEMDS